MGFGVWGFGIVGIMGDRSCLLLQVQIATHFELFDGGTDCDGFVTSW